MKNEVINITREILIVSLVFFQLSFQSIGQSKTMRITGVISDTQGCPIEYANIWIESQLIGTISNEKGRFELNLNRELDNLRLCISHIGYLNDTIYLSDTINDTISIKLENAKLLLNEVLVKPIDINDVINSMPDSILKYYYANNTVYNKIFFQKKVTYNDTLFHLTEAMLYSNIKQKEKEREVNLQIIKGRCFEDTSIIYFPVSNDGYSILKSAGPILDFDSKYSILNQKNKKKYNIIIERIIENGQDIIAVVNFTPKTKYNDKLPRAILYIDLSNYFPIKLIFDYSEITRQKTIRIEGRKFKYFNKMVYEYMQYNDGYYLNQLYVQSVLSHNNMGKDDIIQDKTNYIFTQYSIGMENNMWDKTNIQINNNIENTDIEELNVDFWRMQNVLIFNAEDYLLQLK